MCWGLFCRLSLELRQDITMPKRTLFVNETDMEINIDYTYDRLHILKPRSLATVSWHKYDVKDTLLPSIRFEGVKLDKSISVYHLYENRVITIFRDVDNTYSFRTISDMDLKGYSGKVFEDLMKLSNEYNLKLSVENFKNALIKGLNTDVLETWKLEGPLLIKETRRSIVEILSRLEVLWKKVRIWHNQCEQLLKKFRTGAIELVRRLDTWDLWMQPPSLMKFIRSKFMSAMLEGEALLLLCSRDDNYNKAAFALSSPRLPSVATISEFAIVLRELDWTLDFIWFVNHHYDEFIVRSFEGWKWCKDSFRFVYLRGRDTGSGVTENENLKADASRQTDDRKAFEASLALEPIRISLVSAISSSIFFPLSYLPTARNKKENQDQLKAIWKKRLEFEPAPSLESTSGPNAEGILGCFGIGYPNTTNVGSLGSGTFKNVNKCKWLGETVAVSVFKGVSEDAAKDEASLLARVQHPNVVEFLGYAYKADKRRPEVFLVTELMEQDLDSLIITKLESHDESGKSSSEQPPFFFSTAVDIAIQIVEAMIHLHECGVMHRDLKPGNCMTRPKYGKPSSPGYKDVPEYYTIKLIDFGESKMRVDDSNFQTRRRGTPCYMAPEVWAGIPYTWSADVYSFGVTCYEIFTGRLPFPRDIRFEEVQKIMRGNPSFPFALPSPLQELIKQCWAHNALDRPSCQDVREALWRLKFYAY